MRYMRNPRSSEKSKPRLFRLLIAGCVFVIACSSLPAPAQQQQQQQQQAQQQGQPDQRQVELLRKLGLSRNMSGPPAYALGQSGHFSASAPSNFPIAVYRSNVTGTSFFNSTKGAPSASLNIATKDSPAVVYQFYQTALRNTGWTVQAPSAEAQAKLGQMYMLRGQKEKQMASVTIIGKQAEPGANIAINWYLNP